MKARPRAIGLAVDAAHGAAPCVAEVTGETIADELVGVGGADPAAGLRVILFDRPLCQIDEDHVHVATAVTCGNLESVVVEQTEDGTRILEQGLAPGTGVKSLRSRHRGSSGARGWGGVLMMKERERELTPPRPSAVAGAWL